MNDDYLEYLQSEAWQKKRNQRLAISKFRCAACTESKAVHVHHLTYARIFNEDMADLLPLCEAHHRAAEQLIKKGRLPRYGDVLFLATETIRLIVVQPVQNSNNKIPKYEREKISVGEISIEPRNEIQRFLLSNFSFNAPNRQKFKKRLHEFASQNKSLPYGKMVNNGCALYDRIVRAAKSQKHRSSPKSIQTVKNGASQNGFAQPRRVWTNISERERHEAAFTRINGF